MWGTLRPDRIKRGTARDRPFYVRGLRRYAGVVHDNKGPELSANIRPATDAGNAVRLSGLF